jgi:hypothetical protein
MASSQQSYYLLRCLGWVTNLFCEIRKTDNNPYDPSVGGDIDMDLLPLKEF